MADTVPISPAQTAQDLAGLGLAATSILVPGVQWLTVLGIALSRNSALFAGIYAHLNGQPLTPEQKATWDANTAALANPEADFLQSKKDLQDAGKIS